MSWISDMEAERALDFLRDKAVEIGEARKQMVLAEKMTKRIVALEKKRSDAKTQDGKEQDALCSEAYLTAIVAEAEAAGNFETLRAYRDAAAAKLEVWRSLTANARAMAK
jgi:hypothetical protein